MAATGEALELDEMSPEELICGVPEICDAYDVYGIALRQINACHEEINDLMDRGNFESMPLDELHQWRGVAAEALKYTEYTEL